jgi:RNA polymerase sigma-70 factor (ECF subfamily)
VSSVVEAPKPDAGDAHGAALPSRRGDALAGGVSAEDGGSNGSVSEAGVVTESVVLQYYEDVYRYAHRLSGNGEDAADLAQQAYLLAGRRLHQLREIDRCRSWLLAIVRTCFLKSVQRKRPATATDLELDVSRVEQSEPAASEEEREEVGRALDDLPEADRVILLMFYFEELSYKDIAQQLDIPIGTVMSRLSRAKQRMRQWFDARSS